MVRLGGVDDIVAEEACIVENPGFDPASLRSGAGESPVGESRGHPLVQFQDPEGKETDRVMGLFDPGSIKSLQEVVAVGRVPGSGRDPLQVDVVIETPGLVHGLEFPGIPPIRLGAKVLELLPCFTEEEGKLIR
jgi:hypothetical protein